MSDKDFLRERSRQPEMMDAPDVDPAQLDYAMYHLQVINRWLNGYGPSEKGIQKLLPSGTTEFSLLDVGCGSGDTLREIAMWARQKKMQVRLMGIELSRHSAARAAIECADYPEITIRHQDIFAMDPREHYDVVHCALVLHHFSRDDDAVRFLRRMMEAARWGVVVNDLHRHPTAYKSIKLLTRLFSKSQILRNDAPLSVARAFTRSELQWLAEQAGLTNTEIHWHWAFRWLMVAHKHSNP